MLLAARVLTGAFGGILGGLALAIIADVFPEERRGRATGVLMSAFAVASVVGVPTGIYLGSELGWHVPFLVLAGLGLPVFFVGLRVSAAAARPPSSRVSFSPLAPDPRNLQPSESPASPSL